MSLLSCANDQFSGDDRFPLKVPHGIRYYGGGIVILLYRTHDGTKNHVSPLCFTHHIIRCGYDYYCTTGTILNRTKSWYE